MNEIGLAVVELVEINEYRLIYANEVFLKIRDCTAEEIQEKYNNNIWEFLDVESKIKMNLIMTESLKYKKSNINFDVTINCNDGQRKNLLCKGKLLYDYNAVTMNVIETDITRICKNLAAGIL